MANDIEKLGEAVSQLFEQILTGVGGIENVQVVINIEPQAMAAPEVTPQLVTGVLTRQVLDNGQVALRWLSDNPTEPVTQEVRAPNDDEKQFLQQLLDIDPADPTVEIDDGLVVWRINAVGVGDVITWVPYDANTQPIHMAVPIGPPPGGSGFGSFRECLKTYSAASDKLTKCWGMFFS